MVSRKKFFCYKKIFIKNDANTLVKNALNVIKQNTPSKQGMPIGL